MKVSGPSTNLLPGPAAAARPPESSSRLERALEVRDIRDTLDTRFMLPRDDRPLMLLLLSGEDDSYRAEQDREKKQ